MVRKMAINNNWYETSEDMVMPLPLTEEQIGELPESSLTEEMTEDATSSRTGQALPGHTLAANHECNRDPLDSWYYNVWLYPLL